MSAAGQPRSAAGSFSHRSQRSTSINFRTYQEDEEVDGLTDVNLHDDPYNAQPDPLESGKRGVFSLGGEESLMLRRVFAVRGSSVAQGPHIRFSLRWLRSIHGLEYLQLILWLVKDFAWSQLHWFYLSVVVGSLALLWSLMLVVLVAREGVFSESYLSVGMLLWLLANFVWMVGDLWNEDIMEDPEGEEFFLRLWGVSKYISLGAVLWISMYFWFMIPLNVFWEEQGNALVAQMNHNCPPPRFKAVFRTFREYESLHLFFWAVKDLLWIWDLKWAYLVVFLPTMLLNMDLIFLFATYRDQFIDLAHYVALFFWLLANGVWAYGEMDRENPFPDDISSADWDAYDWPHVPENAHFLPRYAAGWLFVVSCAVVVLFYAGWILRPPKLVSARVGGEDLEIELERRIELRERSGGDDKKTVRTSTSSSDEETVASAPALDEIMHV